MVDFLIDNWKFLIQWHLLGCFLAGIAFAKRQEMVKIEDLTTIALMGVLGPCWLLITLLEYVIKYYGKRKDLILWQSKRQRAKAILYDKDDTGQVPRQ